MDTTNIDNAQSAQIEISSKRKPELSKNSKIVLERRYLAKDDKGKVTETAEDLFKRVAGFIASADYLYKKTIQEVSKTANEFYELMASLQFIPNSPTGPFSAVFATSKIAYARKWSSKTPTARPLQA